MTASERKKEIIDKYENGTRIIDFEAEFCRVTSTVVTMQKKKEAIKGADVVVGAKKTTLATCGSRRNGKLVIIQNLH